MAVPIFMVISGYVYTSSCERNRIISFTDYYKLNFFLPKLLRFFIPFCVAFSFEIYMKWITVGKLSFRYIEMTFWEGGTGGPGTYYIPVMLQFCLFFPLIYFMVKKFSFIGFCLCFISNVCYEYFHVMYRLSEPLYSYLFFRYVSVVADRCWLSLNQKKKIRWYVLSASFITGILFLILHTYLGKPSYIFRDWTSTSCISTLYILPVCYFLLRRGNENFLLLEILGKASFNIYLVQVLFYLFFADKVYTITDATLLALLINEFVCCGVGVIFWFVESFVTKTINSKLRSLSCPKIAKLNCFFSYE